MGSWPSSPARRIRGQPAALQGGCRVRRHEGRDGLRVGLAGRRIWAGGQASPSTNACGVGDPKMGAEMLAISQISPPLSVSKRMERLRVVRPGVGPAWVPYADAKADDGRHALSVEDR